ncbi:MAG TPA: hypothetical protein VEF04_22520 [Blastocatellia bacterium]|nr:hypothetical protein [Blastocatellia bacterium]
MNTQIIENATALDKAKSETQRLLALLNEEQPNADELKDVWYTQGFAVRNAIAELRRAEEALIQPLSQTSQIRRQR